MNKPGLSYMRAALFVPALLLCLLCAITMATAQVPEGFPDSALVSDSLVDILAADSLSAASDTLRRDSATNVPARRRREITPVNNAATETQSTNNFDTDTALYNKYRREHWEQKDGPGGVRMYVDTATGEQWLDTIGLEKRRKEKVPYKYPRLESATVAVDLWDPLMRAFGQHYGMIGFMGQISLYNRFKPTFEMGLGLADNTPDDNNYTYKSPMSVYFRLGMDYNFLFRSTSDYQLLGGIRYGFSPFSYSIENITIASTYWDEVAHPVIPSQTATVGWLELCAGLRVNLCGAVSAGWMVRYHSILHDHKSPYGRPWYIPGYGARGSAFSGSLFVTYTIDLSHLNH